MGVTSFAYRLVFLLHILCAIIGFGGVILNGLYAARAKKRPPAEGLAVMEVNTFVSVKVAEIFIYLTAIWGLGLVGLSHKVWKFSQTWVWLAIVIYILALGVSHGLLMPRVKKLLAYMRTAVAGGGPTRAWKRVFPFDRNQVRRGAAFLALELLRRRALGIERERT